MNNFSSLFKFSEKKLFFHGIVKDNITWILTDFCRKNKRLCSTDGIHYIWTFLSKFLHIIYRQQRCQKYRFWRDMPIFWIKVVPLGTLLLLKFAFRSTTTGRTRKSGIVKMLYCQHRQAIKKIQRHNCGHCTEMEPTLSTPRIRHDERQKNKNI